MDISAERLTLGEQKQTILHSWGKEGQPPHLKYFFWNHLLPGFQHAELRVRVEKDLNDRRGWRAGFQHLVGHGETKFRLTGFGV